ncbi:MAG: sigma-70 family RNA polymerase sigma factor, partial [Actinobacteria bacterium]|nr:sigma-70 family RNA polymerase sigma factor [Actinomycetota bacterium]
LQRYIARRADPSVADDVLVDTLTVLWRRLDDVPADDPLPWSYGVARRSVANARRSGHRQQQLVVRLASQPAHAIDAGPGDDPASDGELEAALARLSDADRELVRLWAWEGLEPREIAVALDSTANAISIRLHRLRRRLADELRRDDGKDRMGAGHEMGERHGRGEEAG